MCGIFGILSHPIVKDDVVKATDALAHRGPDDCGFYISHHVGLGHRRLSIIDISGGHQPLFNEDGSICIIFNGEIYNHCDLRQILLALGHRFKTRTDTEAILHAYEEWGEACVGHLRGMFSFAIWNEQTRQLFLARDRLGIKPLFYALQEGTFLFASEMKAILALERFPREMDEQAVAAFFTFSYIPKSLTIYKNIHKLLPGHTLTFKDGRCRLKKYWDLHFEPQYGKSEAYFIDGFMGLLEDAVRTHLMSEVPLGAFLSGGVDSSTIVALMSRNLRSALNTFCIGFGGNSGGHLDERRFAKKVSQLFSTNHREYQVEPRIEPLLDTIVSTFDEPFADDSAIPTYYVSRMAREDVTVALSGLGGDEVFAGYERHLGLFLQALYSRFPTIFRERLIRPIAERLPERRDGHYTINHLKRFVRSASLPADQAYFGFSSMGDLSLLKSLFSEPNRFSLHFDSCRDLFLAEFNSENVVEPNDFIHRAMYCDIKMYLPEDILAVTDRMSMQHGLEVRVPFLDHVFLEFCGTIPATLKLKWFQKKYLLKKAVRNLLPKPVLDHRKQGFIGPMTQWLKKDLRFLLESRLQASELMRHGFFNERTVERIIHEHLSGREIHDTLLWALLIFQKWHDRFIGKH
ncbi:MAG: asparagine synthase (glutamine-hydrolyzing) [Deltaproteobacteria bacterium HGW-Deltaproteobacteria-15]|jgi:asparagine synthase (glutamine-hydrolysing)|nr:MAG: asparagine synthase (glutamine-hydrolyzing) [Deltaproteobacteria bacterium HGW-Deltaproteobacteria-15]